MRIILNFALLTGLTQAEVPKALYLQYSTGVSNDPRGSKTFQDGTELRLYRAKWIRHYINSSATLGQELEYSLLEANGRQCSYTYRVYTRYGHEAPSQIDSLNGKCVSAGTLSSHDYPNRVLVQLTRDVITLHCGDPKQAFRSYSEPVNQLIGSEDAKPLSGLIAKKSEGYRAFMGFIFGSNYASVLGKGQRGERYEYNKQMARKVCNHIDGIHYPSR